MFLILSILSMFSRFAPSCGSCERMSSAAKVQRNNDLGKFFNIKSVGVAVPSLVAFSHADDADSRGDISHGVLFPTDGHG